MPIPTLNETYDATGPGPPVLVSAVPASISDELLAYLNATAVLRAYLAIAVPTPMNNQAAIRNLIIYLLHIDT